MFALTLAIVCELASSAQAGPRTGAVRPWLFMSDVHFDIYAKPSVKANYKDGDTNVALLESTLREAHAIDPDPPVVVIAGDFIAHHARFADSASTMATLARDFDRTFPHAQFVFTLGNNDSSCGDYTPNVDGAFLRAVAIAWAPLVNRAGASPEFVRSFSHDGSYVARLPLPGLRAIVVNDNFFTLRFDSKCAGANAASKALDRLDGLLSATPPHTRNWTLFHVPPGIDAFSTAHLTHGLAVVPFLRPRSRDDIVAILGDPRSHVALAIAGHTHKFSFRVIPGGGGGTGVPMLLVPSISPIFGNAPSFLTAPVEKDGTLGDVAQYGFDGDTWSRIGDLAELGVPRFTARPLEVLQTALLNGSPYREKFAVLYEGGARPEIAPRTWSVYACAATHFTDSSFEACTGKSGYSVLTRRGVALALAATLVLAGFVAVFIVRARRRRARLA